MRANPRITLISLVLLVFVLLLYTVNLGALSLSFFTLWREQNENLWNIWFGIRLPRVLLALVVGLSLALSGSVMQGIFRNPLADPTLMGVSSGASLCVALVILLQVPPFLALYGQMLAAFLGGMLIALFIFFLSRREVIGISRLLLAGIAINTLCGALIGALSYLSNDQQLRQFFLWSMGSLGQAQWSTLGATLLFVLPTGLACLFLSGRLNLLQLGDEEAHYLGVNVARTRRQLLFLSTILTTVTVAASGMIGFIGLVVPHLLRMHIGADHRWLLPCSALGGACLLLVADALARTLVAPAEMPVGMLTSLLGAPYFLWLILRGRGEKSV